MQYFLTNVRQGCTELFESNVYQSSPQGAKDNPCFWFLPSPNTLEPKSQEHGITSTDVLRPGREQKHGPSQDS